MSVKKDPTPAPEASELAPRSEIRELVDLLRGKSDAEKLNHSQLSTWREAEAARPLAPEAYLFYRRRDTRSVSIDRFQRMSNGVFKRCEPRPGFPRNHPDEIRKIEDEVFSSANGSTSIHGVN